MFALVGRGSAVVQIAGMKQRYSVFSQEINKTCDMASNCVKLSSVPRACCRNAPCMWRKCLAGLVSAKRDVE